MKEKKKEEEEEGKGKKRRRKGREGEREEKEKGQEKTLFSLSTLIHSHLCVGFPGGSDGKESACNAGDPGLIPGLGRSLGEGNGNPFFFIYSH